MATLEMAKAYIISASFAKYNNLPVSFIAQELKQTERAIYLYGHGSTEPTGRCIRCGRVLTHPGSIILGIGPECLGNWGLRDITLEAPTASDIAKIETTVHSQIIDQWIPKSCIKTAQDSHQPIIVPSGHSMLTSNNNTTPAPIVERKASLVSYQSTGNSVIKIEFPYNMEDVLNVKNIVGRKYAPEGKYWTAPLSLPVIEELKSWGFILSPAILEYIDKVTQTITDESSANINIPGLKGTLMPFQKTGVAFAESRDGRVLIGDEQGLGKTIEALAWLQLHPEARPAVIICPASLKLNWEKEAHSWITTPNTQVLNGNNHDVELTGDVIILNYDILGNQQEIYRDTANKKRTRQIANTGWVDYLVKYGVNTVVIDECQYIKTNGTIRTNGTKRLAKNAKHVIALSGTPIENKPIEFFNIIQLINRNIMPNWYNFIHKYCGAHRNGFGWDLSGATNTVELHQKLTDTIMIRRLKVDVLPELPNKQYTVVPMEMSSWTAYNKANIDFLHFIKETKGIAAARKTSNAEQLTKIETLKQLAVAGKLKQAISWIEDRIEAGDKIVLFAVHKTVIDAIMNKFKGKAVKIDGSVSSAKREAAVVSFQTDDSIRLFVGNIKAAGVGLTLTASSTVVFLELPWSPSDLGQAEDRCHRIGQHDSVNVYYLLAAGTIEDTIATLLDKKRKILDAVLDGKETEQNSMLVELMNKFTNESERSIS